MRAAPTDVAPDATEPDLAGQPAVLPPGTSGQWRSLLDDAALERYFGGLRVAPGDIARWLHRNAVLA